MGPRDVSFRVEPADFAIVGHTGAGKTPDLPLLRFYDVQRGQILLDGKTSPHDSRICAASSASSQDPFLFTGPSNRISASAHPASTAIPSKTPLKKSARRVIRSLPEGVASTSTSALHSFRRPAPAHHSARALATIRVLILDEATSTWTQKTNFSFVKLRPLLSGAPLWSSPIA